ncbi:MAG: hypothetical protein D3916_19185, partial [Candidatus Electrothrix sp. MAN1_4]|nr:hypothetical protein [Candidatus Electrothrix sp. MAN1_4]
TDQEVQQLLTWNDTAAEYPADKTIVDLFEEQAAKTPDNIAAVFEEQQLTYAELNRKANQLARYLLNLKKGFKNNADDFLIAIAVERSPEMVIGLLAILKAGAAYVPIDPDYPAARIRHMLDDSTAPLLLTQSRLKAQLPLDELDVCFGVTVSGRNAPLSGIEEMIGLFINTLPLRIDADPEDSVRDYMQKIQTRHQDDNRYAHSPLFEIQTNSDVPNGTALFVSLLVFDNYPLGDALEPDADCYQIEDFQGIEYTNYPLTVAVMPGEELHFKVSYDSSRISGESLKRLWEHFKTLLIAFVDNPDLAVGGLSMLTDQEVQQLQTWNDTAAEYPADKTIVDL